MDGLPFIADRMYFHNWFAHDIRMRSKYSRR